MVDLHGFLLVVIVGAVMGTASASYLLRVFGHLVRGKRESCTKGIYGVHAGWFTRISVVLTVFGAICFAYGMFVEPFWPEIEHLKIATDKLSQHSPPIRLVLISDTHSDPVARLEPELPEQIARLNPDVILFAGDPVNSKHGLPVFQSLMSNLSKVAPTYAVRGNWDVWWYADIDFYGTAGVEVLEHQPIPLQINNQVLWLSGFSVLSGSTGRNKQQYLMLVQDALDRIPTKEPVVFLHHFPEVAAMAVEKGALLGLSGDTHGGQVRLPLLGPLIRISRFGRYFDIGQHALGNGWLYVNRGIGMEGGKAPRVRFLCRPEITLIEISGKTN